MLKKLLKLVRKQLLKCDCVESAVSNYYRRLKVERLTKILMSGGTFRI